MSVDPVRELESRLPPYPTLSSAVPHLFERFYRGTEGRGHYPEGTGLGLAIARWVVDTHGGEITVTSDLGKGTTVPARLPH